MSVIVVQCDNCGKQYTMSVGEYNKKRKRGYIHFFCSKKCYGEFRKRDGYKTCPVCGKVFHSKPSWEVRFCSLECYNTFRKNGYKTRSGYYVVNEHFFKAIQTEEQAYVLGLLFADGYISKSGITFTSKDIDLLEAIKRVMHSEHPIYMKTNRLGSWGVLFIGRRRMADDLLNLLRISGGRKADRLKYPQIPPELDRHFIRGFLDGDGSVSSCSGNSRILFFSASHDFLRELDDKIRFHLGLLRPHKISKTRSNCYRLVYQKGRAIAFGAWLYKDAKIYLKRKADKWETMLSCYHTNRKQ